MASVRSVSRRLWTCGPTSTQWAAVAMYPLGLMTKPVHAPVVTKALLRLLGSRSESKYVPASSATNPDTSTCIYTIEGRINAAARCESDGRAGPSSARAGGHMSPQTTDVASATVAARRSMVDMLRGPFHAIRRGSSYSASRLSLLLIPEWGEVAA